MKNFGRLLTAMVTPMDSNMQVDYKQAAALAVKLVDEGCDGLVVVGTTGESPTLTKDEKLKMYATVLDAVGDRASVIAGTGSNDTAASIALTQAAEKLGVHGAMLVGPYYNKPSQEGFYQHFKAVSEATALPLVVYNVPGRTGKNIEPETVIRLAELKNVVAVKEASGNVEQAAQIRRNTPADFTVYSGDDSLTLPMMAVGGYGIISVAAHCVAAQMKEMITAFVNGDNTRACKLHLELLPFFKVIFITANPTPIKLALNLSGFEVGGVRLPLVMPNDKEQQAIVKVMKELKLL